MQVKQLPMQLDYHMFEQVGKHFYLTAASRELLATCQEIFKKLSQFEIVIADLKGLKQGYLWLAAIATTKYVTHRLLVPFCQRHPGIDISLTSTNHERVLENLANNRDNLYILSQLPKDFDLSIHPFLENPLVALASHHHPLATEKNPYNRRLEVSF